MTWQFERKPWAVFPRNPLDSVVIQLRFQPILSISTGKRVDDFQNLIRESFPGYEVNEQRTLSVSLDKSVDIEVEKVYNFLRRQDEAKLQLKSDHILIECKRHHTRDTLIADFLRAIDALCETYEPIETTRLGCRYVNVISTDLIQRELNKEVSLESLIQPEYLSVPGGLTDLENTVFINQITSNMPAGGMNLRYGLIRMPGQQGSNFNFDIDRFIEGAVDLAGIEEILLGFTDDIFSLFSTLPGKDLEEWMSKPVGSE